MPKAFKSCPKLKKSPNLVTLLTASEVSQDLNDFFTWVPIPMKHRQLATSSINKCFWLSGLVTIKSSNLLGQAWGQNLKIKIPEKLYLFQDLTIPMHFSRSRNFARPQKMKNTGLPDAKNCNHFKKFAKFAKRKSEAKNALKYKFDPILIDFLQIIFLKALQRV